MSIYQHFRKEEHAFIDQVTQWSEQVKKQYSYKLLDFLDPREQEILHSIIGTKGEVKCRFWGGFEHAERKRAILFPEYYEPEIEDFELALFTINYPRKFVKLEHRKILGSLMGLGLKRSKFGDILIGDLDVQFITIQQIAEFVRVNFHQVGKTNISVEEIPFRSMVIPNEAWQEITITVSSLRLDVILANVHHLSRQRVTPYIQNKLVKVNWKIIEDNSYICHKGDTLSLRGYGRCMIKAIEGQTKKEKWRIVVLKKK
ncbi:YlmH family RNA-binding protein [Calidifontibacillus oryziterrae]|uniref:YlmH family RNA-binding protein n=1 Tax=Calidifontibacillus oryziterrae TaxID=1191699 RepID=UPI0002FF5276|nr:RNA-binding protein [Calidifontibacillus oryziterrae]